MRCLDCSKPRGRMISYRGLYYSRRRSIGLSRNTMSSTETQQRKWRRSVNFVKLSGNGGTAFSTSIGSGMTGT